MWHKTQMDTAMTMQHLQFQRARGFRNLRFVPELERQFQRHRFETLRGRAKAVGVSALALFLIYCVLDYACFPQRLWAWTIPVRLFVTCPVIIMVFVLLRMQAPQRLFLAYYNFSYLWGGLSLVLIIGLARWQRVDMPYDGVLLALMFGYFLMGLSWRAASWLSSLVVMAYLATEWLAGTEHQQIFYNSFFLLTAHAIGMVGSWLQEYQQRAHFLDRCQLDQARSKAEQDSHRKSRFVAVASHDLRQPLNVINLLLENLRGTLAEADRKRMVDHLLGSVDHLNRLLESVLDISRLEEGMVRAEPEAVDLVPFLERMRTELEAAVDARGVALDYEFAETAWARADVILLRRILRNLVLNALQHANCSRILITLNGSAERISLCVSDDGRGIEPHTRSTLFEPYIKGLGSPGHEGGLGLGLAIVRQLARLMGGDCELMDDAGGARFRVSLPTAPARTRPRENVAPVPSESQRGCIWLVENHRQTREWMARLLSHWGYRVAAFNSAGELFGREPVQETDAPDLVLTALHLGPGEDGQPLPDDHAGATAMVQDGFRCLAQVRARYGTVPAVVMTGDVAPRIGYDANQHLWVLRKPIRPATLRTVLMRLRAATLVEPAQ